MGRAASTERKTKRATSPTHHSMADAIPRTTARIAPKKPGHFQCARGASRPENSRESLVEATSVPTG